MRFFFILDLSQQTEERCNRERHAHLRPGEALPSGVTGQPRAAAELPPDTRADSNARGGIGSTPFKAISRLDLIHDQAGSDRCDPPTQRRLLQRRRRKTHP